MPSLSPACVLQPVGSIVGLFFLVAFAVRDWLALCSFLAFLQCPIKGEAGPLISSGAWFRSGVREQCSAKHESGFMQTNVILLGKVMTRSAANQPFVFQSL